MRFTVSVFLAAILVCSASDKKKPVVNEAGNDHFDFVAEPLITPDQIKAALGMELPPGIIAVQLRITPKGESPVNISRDDFVLLSRKDGQRSGPYSPSQIAGSATMVVKNESVGGGGIGRQRNGPIWGGIPGTGQRPRQMDDGTGMSGTMASHETKTTASVQGEKAKDDSPLLAVLAEKMLKDVETSDPLNGLLYFPLDGKVKMKDLALIYKGPAGRLVLEFR